VAVAITMLGSFAVEIDATPVDAAHWRRRAGANLVKVLALAPNRRLHREQIFDQMWPELSPAEAAPRLHKAVHLARKALGADAIDTNGDMVQLFPAADVRIDVVDFELAATAALDLGDDIESALEHYTGELLPDDRYEPWADTPRNRVAHLHRQLLRAGRRWSELIAHDPTDEDAHVALMRAHVERGDGAAAVSQYERLAAVLDDELGVRPGSVATELRDQALALPPPPPAPDPTGATLPRQEIRFCHAADGVRLAYSVDGSGPPVVKAANWLTHLEYDWESTVWRHWLTALTSRFRVLRYDERGCGLSDWNTTSFNIEAWIDDLATVVDAAGYEQFVLFGISQGAAVAVEYAARHPERVKALILYGGYIHGRLGRAMNDEDMRVARLLPELAELGWGSDDPSFRQVFTVRFMPDASRERWDEFNELQRKSTSGSNAAKFIRGFASIDISDAAPKVSCPTLVVHARGDLSPPLAEGRLLASMIPGSRFVSLDSRNHLLLADEPAWPRFVEEVDRFLADI
jgi:DNA-binding SARP family transcriptional activator/pimeloyl-ACP methyl ester carboxylesterase